MSGTFSNQSAEKIPLKTRALEVLKLTGRLAVQELSQLPSEIMHPFTSSAELRLRKEEPPLTPAQRKMAVAAIRPGMFDGVEPESHER